MAAGVVFAAPGIEAAPPAHMSEHVAERLTP